MRYLKTLGVYIITAGFLTLLFRNTAPFNSIFSLFLRLFLVFLAFHLIISGFQRLFESKFPRFKVVGIGIGTIISIIISALILGII